MNEINIDESFLEKYFKNREDYLLQVRDGKIVATAKKDGQQAQTIKDLKEIYNLVPKPGPQEAATPHAKLLTHLEGVTKTVSQVAQKALDPFLDKKLSCDDLYGNIQNKKIPPKPIIFIRLANGRTVFAQLEEIKQGLLRMLENMGVLTPA